MKKMIKAQVL